MNPNVKETGCCPILKTEDWDKKELVWKDKLFLKTRFKAVFHIPLGFGRIITKAMTELQTAGAVPEMPMMLCCDETLFGGTMLIAAEKEIPGWETERISGSFLSRIFEGGYSQTGNWIRETQKYAREQGKTIDKIYTFYGTCPKCAKAYGAAQTVVLAKEK